MRTKAGGSGWPGGVRAIVEIRWGPLRGHKVVLSPGEQLRVGRTERADLVVPHDRQMAGLHFELSWDGAACALRSLTQAAPLALDGEPVAGGTVSNGSWIKAGETIFHVYLEEHTPPRRGAGAEPSPDKDRALALLESLPLPLFAVLDAARDDRILEILRESAEPHRSLYEGIRGEALSEVAPYLASTPPGSSLLRRLVLEGWGRRWGIYLTSARPFKEVRTHLRRFLMVLNDADEKRLYFRYYDPATLRAFIPACSGRQAAELFGPIGAFVAEGESGGALRFEAGASRGEG